MTRQTPLPRAASAELVATVIGCLCVTGALGIIWVARSTVVRDVYVSEMGAPGEPTAGWFRVALLLIVAGAALIAFGGRDIRSRLRVLSAWTPAVSLWIGSACFLIASQVTCTTGCPIPAGSTFTWQDLIHIVVAVLAFTAACWAMLQTAFARGHRALAITSLCACIAVALIAGAGGLMSLFSFYANLGGRFELVATTIALAWLVTFGVFVAAGIARRTVSAVPA